MTGGQIRRLFFRRADGGLATTQTVNTRLRRLVSHGYLDVVVVDRGRGSGPYAYGLGTRGSGLLGDKRPRRRGAPGSVWHALELAEFRVRLEEALGDANGALVEWIGDTTLRSLLAGQRGWPVPDALVHWRLQGSEGAFFLEWDRGTAVSTVDEVIQDPFARHDGHAPETLRFQEMGDQAPFARWSDDHRKTRLELQPGNEEPTPRFLVVCGRNLIAAEVIVNWWRSDLSARASLFV